MSISNEWALTPDAEPALTPERIRYLRKARKNKLIITSTKILLLALFFLLWELAANLGLIDSFITSQPSRMLAVFSRMAGSGELWAHLAVTTGEAVAGFLLGTFLGTAFAVLLWWKPFVYKVLEPYLVILNALPKIALGPIFIIWLGAGPISIVVITLTVSIVVSILEVLGGFLNTDPEQIKLIQTFGGTKRQTLAKVILPSNYGTIVNSLKINVGMSWVGVIVGEFLVSRAGLGYLIVYGSQVFQLDLVMMSVMVLAVVAAIMYLGVVCLERLITKREKTV